MTARDGASVGSLVAGLMRSQRPRTDQHVRRNSRHASEFERRRWRQTNMFPRSEHNARMSALEHIKLSTKMKGKRRGLVGDVEMETYRYMLRRRGKLDGRLDMAIDTIAKDIRRARSAVIEALKRLKELGFVDWLRRTAPVEDPEPGGQYVQQITNAYFLTLPPKAAELLRRIFRRPTEASRAATRQRAVQAEFEAMTPEDQAAQFTDPELFETLERMRLHLLGASPPDGHNGTL
ncbi:MAG: hypothetical protein QHC67_01285 [Sphingobium sp.]|uniref:hypothetical protein n=1 Tax=Sphingobium sp. TaxID=1912891 RepID=UPI0029A39E11|nr:hypothetical protein [Sphingobium sp.]MDX3908441.1 hypothetical protein [Sphingobium sp.]